MKNWFSIGEFANEVGVSTRTLRFYESKGLISSHTRGDNGYRYFQASEVEKFERLKSFKDLGFSLTEIKVLLNNEISLDEKKLLESLTQRLADVEKEEGVLKEQKEKLHSIISSLKKKSSPLNHDERRYIMSLIPNVSIVITGTKNLEQTAEFIQGHLKITNMLIPIVNWSEESNEDHSGPIIRVIHENQLGCSALRELRPDIVVIKDVSECSAKNFEGYLNLYAQVGPHMTTIMNADDRVSIELAGEKQIQKGRIYYFAKNSGLESQLKNIGGILSDGEDVKVFGFNKQPLLNLKLKSILPYDKEVALIASVAAVMDIGLHPEDFAPHLQV